MPTEGLIVIDIDAHHGIDGKANFEALVAKKTPMPETRMVTTMNNGEHHYYRCPEGIDIRNSTGKLCAGVDVRSAGGYIIIPRGDDCPYTLAKDLPIVDAPEWIVDALKRESTADAQEPTSDAGSNDIPAGRRNAALVSLAGALQSKGVTPETIKESLHAENVARCNPPLPASEVDGICKSIARYPHGAEREPVARAKQGKPYAMTDLGNAERLVYWNGDGLRWDVARKVWRVWDGKRWAVDTALNVNRRAAETARRIRAEAAVAPRLVGESKGPDVGELLFKHAVKSESRDRLAAMLEVAKSRPGVAIAASEMDTDTMLLNVANGTIDLRTGELRPHRRADLITKLAPVEYIKGHTDARWDGFLDDATGGDKELADFLQIATGYTLTGDTSEERMFLVYGPTAGGKSTYLDAVREAMGDYARTVNADILAKRKDANAGNATPELAALVGARLAAGSEMEQGREVAEALAKNLTGGEPITARHLYAEMFDFRPQFKLWLALNHCPRVSADDAAIWRRVLRIGFEHTVPKEKRDRTLKPYLRDPEGGGRAVLAWAVEGCLRWQRKGLIVPAAVERSTAEYRTESDPLAAFIEDCLVFTDGESWTAWHDIWSAYTEHADDYGTAQRYRVAPRRLQERLKARDCVAYRKYTGRGWSGVMLKPDRHAVDHDTMTPHDANSVNSPIEENTKEVYGNTVMKRHAVMPTQDEMAECLLAHAEGIAV